MQCAHTSCTCLVTAGLEYCGPSCRQNIEDPGGDACLCGHADCDATTGQG